MRSKSQKDIANSFLKTKSTIQNNFYPQNETARHNQMSTSDLRQNLSQNKAIHTTQQFNNQQKPLIVQNSKLPPAFLINLKQSRGQSKRMKNSKSEEKFAFNDMIDYSRFQSGDVSQQGQFEISRKNVGLKHKIHDLINNNMLNEKDPDLYQTIVLQKQKEKMLKQKFQISSKFESRNRQIENEAKQSLNSSRTSLWDVQQIHQIDQEHRSLNVQRDSFSKHRESIRQQKIPFSQRLEAVSPKKLYSPSSRRLSPDNDYQKEDLELQVSKIHLNIRKSHKKRLEQFLQHHNTQLERVHKIKKDFKEEQEIKQSPHYQDNEERFFQMVRDGNCTDIYINITRRNNCEFLNKMRDQWGNTPLHIAVLQQNYDMVELLIFFGVDVFAKNQRKQDAEDLAQDIKNQDILNLIKMKKAKITIRYNMWKIREYDRICKLRSNISSRRLSLNKTMT
eukprot:403375614